MIDPYLKTSMPVYDSIDRQNHRNKCCKSEDFKLYTDKWHLPPFQIFIPDYKVDIKLFIDDINFYTIKDGYAAPAPFLNFEDRVNYYDDGTNTWIVYNGLALKSAMPVGQYYLRFRIRFCDREDMYFWTEVFTVCDCELISGILNEELILNGDFSSWTGVYPNRNPDNWAISETAPAEISEVHRNAGYVGGAPVHGNLIEGWSSGTAYNVFTFAGTQITDCQETTGNGGAAVTGLAGGGNSIGFAVCEGETINIQCNINYVSGTLPYILLNKGTSGPWLPGNECSNAVRLTVGANNINLVATRSVPEGITAGQGVFIAIYNPVPELVRFNTTGAIVVTGFKSCNLYSPAAEACSVRQNILTVNKNYLVEIEITKLVLGSIYFRLGVGGEIVVLNTEGVHKYIRICITDNTFAILRVSACDVTIDNVSVREVGASTMCNMLSLTWWNDCDIFDDIVYKYGYKNRLILDTALENPRAEITKNGPTPRLCETFFENIQHKEYYNFKIRLSKFAYYALNRLPLYADMQSGHVIITLPNGDSAEISDIAIDGEWDNENCFNTFTLEFIQDCLIITNCCEDISLTEM